MLYEAARHRSLSDPSIARYLKVNLTTRDEDKGPRASTDDGRTAKLTEDVYVRR